MDNLKGGFNFNKPRTNDRSNDNEARRIKKCSSSSRSSYIGRSSGGDSRSSSSSCRKAVGALAGSDLLPKLGDMTTMGLDGQEAKENEGNSRLSHRAPLGRTSVDTDIKTASIASPLSRRKRDREQVTSPQPLSKRRNIKDPILSLAVKAQAAASSSPFVRHSSRKDSPNISGFRDHEAHSRVLDNKWSGVPQSLKDKIVKEEVLFKAAESRLKARLLRLNEGNM
mmetsp:Transcript_8710/g.11969  ORF Transcript_8710/g.11969 Transcript_8710/m.11969 type:complete len:225 (-) Transcript_8710:190-864(-)